MGIAEPFGAPRLAHRKVFKRDLDRVALHRSLGVRFPAERRSDILRERLHHVGVVRDTKLVRLSMTLQRLPELCNDEFSLACFPRRCIDVFP